MAETGPAVPPAVVPAWGAARHPGTQRPATGIPTRVVPIIRAAGAQASSLQGNRPRRVGRAAAAYAAAATGGQAGGGWQESRTIRCGRTLDTCRGAPSACSSIAAEIRPVSRVSRRTEVSGGHRREARGLSS